MKVKIFPDIKQKSTILTWMSRQAGFVATESQAKVPNVCGLREIPVEDKYSNPTLEILTKDLATVSEIVKMLGVVSKEDSRSNYTEIKARELHLVVVAKAHDFWEVCRVLKTISFINTEKEMVKGDFEGELIAGEVYLKDGEATFSGGTRSNGFQIQNPPYPNHKEVVEWLAKNPLHELAMVTSEISAEGKPQPIVQPGEPGSPTLGNLAFHKEANYPEKEGRYQAFLDWAGTEKIPVVLKGGTYTVQFDFDGGNDRIDLRRENSYREYPEKVNFRFCSVPNREVLEKVRVLLGLTEINLVSEVKRIGLAIETLYALGFRKTGAEKFYEFVQRNGFVAKYDISEKKMTTSQNFALAEITPEQLAVAKKKLEAFIAKVMDAAENRPKEVEDGEKVN